MNARTKSPPAPFSYLDCLRRADETLAMPPRWSWVQRVRGRGECVARFALPLSLCPTLNAFAEMPSWKRAKLKTQVGHLMLIQNGGRRRRSPLAGRPLVRAIRFSCRPPDDDSAWIKIPTDVLKSKLGFIQDDSPRAVERVTWSEWAPRCAGFALLEVWADD